MKAYLTIGMPASGKTTWTEQQTDFININLDDCRAEVCGDAGNHAATPEAVVLHDQKIKKAASEGKDIIISDTNLNAKYRDILVQKLIDLGYQVEYFLFPISLDLARERNGKRLRVVPDTILEAMYKSYQETSLPGKVFLGQTLISNQLIGELNQLVNLEILIPSSELKNEQEEFLRLNMIRLEGNYWSPGANLKSWLQDRGLLQLSLTSYLSANIDSILSDEAYELSSVTTLNSLVKIVTLLFSYSLGEEKKVTIANDLLRQISLIKTCFNEKEQLVNPIKLSEIIKEIIK